MKDIFYGFKIGVGFIVAQLFTALVVLTLGLLTIGLVGMQTVLQTVSN